MSHLHKLDKATRDRHFPESNGGKGSKPRTSTSETRKSLMTTTTRYLAKRNEPNTIRFMPTGTSSPRLL